MGSSIYVILREQTAVCFTVALLVVLLGATTGGAAAAPTPVGTDSSMLDIENAPDLLQSEPTTVNDTQGSTDLPPPHRNPDKIDQTSDLEQLEAILGSSLNRKLGGSLSQLDAEDYERARALLGEEYESDLGRYLDIAEDTDTTTEANLYETVRSQQEDYVNDVEEYDSTRGKYEQAQAEGNEQRARELAREVVRSAEEVNASGTQLAGTYQRLDQVTGINTSAQVQQIESRQREAQQIQEQITTTGLRETTLTVATSKSEVSFTDPVTVRGELRTVSGEAIGNQEVQLMFRGESYRVELDADGSFQRQFRPDGVWQSGPVEVRYVPDPESLYLGSETILPVTVESTPTDIAIDSIDGLVSYDSSLRVRGRVTTAATEEPVPTAPVALQLDGQQTETVQTTSDGQFQFQTPIPPDVPAGAVSTRVRLESSSLALGPSQTETTVQIEPTNTSLTVDATASSPDEIQVQGQLESTSGRVVRSMPVSLRIDDTGVTTVTTDERGRYETTLTLTETTETSESIIVTAQFAGAESNLQAATATTTIAVPQVSESTAATGSNGGKTGIGGSPESGTAFLLLLGLLVVIAAIGWWLRQWRSDSSASAETSPSKPEGETQSESSGNSSEAKQLLKAANEALNNQKSESAVKFAYIAIRRHFSNTVETSETATHWEWYQACTAAGLDQLSELRSFIEGFEEVTFAPTTKHTLETADRMVSTARKLIGDD